MRLARDISNKEMDPEEFMARAEALVVQYPELQAITWIDASRRIIASQVTPSLAAGNPWVAGEKLKPGDTETTFGLARDLLQPVYSQPAASTPTMPLLQLHNVRLLHLIGRKRADASSVVDSTLTTTTTNGCVMKIIFDT